MITLTAVINLIAWHTFFVVAYTSFFMFVSIAFRSLAGALVTSYLYLITITILLPADGSLVRYELHWIVRNFGIFEPTATNSWYGIIVTLAWLVIPLVAGMLLFNRQDIK